MEIPRWGFLVSLLLAPWAFGCTGALEVEWLSKALLAVFALWIGANLLDRRMPHLSIVPTLLMLCLLAQGWCMTLNPRSTFDSDFHRFLPLAHSDAYPSTIDQAASWPRMLLFSGLFGVFCIVSDMARDRRWQMLLASTVAFTGASLILYGLGLRLLGFRMILWVSQIPGNTWPFATYLYHGNAGAYINLVWPVMVAFTVLCFQREANGLARALWVSAAAISAAGIFVNASKAATLIGCVLLLVMAGWSAVTLFRSQPRFKVVATIAYSIIVIAALVVVAWSVGWDVSLERWSHLNAELTEKNLRLDVDRVCLVMAHDSGLWGFGPGTFAKVFPFYTSEFGSALSGQWQYAHEDYLQTTIEWGVVGSVLWALLFFGGLLCVIFTHLARVSRTEKALAFASIIALMGVALHGLVDFPLQIASILLYVFTFLGIAWGSLGWERMAGRKGHGRRSSSRRELSREASGTEPLAGKVALGSNEGIHLNLKRLVRGVLALETCRAQFQDSLIGSRTPAFKNSLESDGPAPVN